MTNGRGGGGGQQNAELLFIAMLFFRNCMSNERQTIAIRMHFLFTRSTALVAIVFHCDLGRFYLRLCMQAIVSFTIRLVHANNVRKNWQLDFS